MHVSNLVSPAPAVPRSDARSESSRTSDFGAVYDAGERRTSRSDTPRGEPAEPQKAAAPRDKDTGSTPANARGQEKAAEDSKADDTAAVDDTPVLVDVTVKEAAAKDGEAPRAKVDAEASRPEEPAVDAAASTADPTAESESIKKPVTPEEVALAMAEAPTPQRHAGHGGNDGETKTSRGAPLVAGQVTAPPADGPAAAAPAEEPGPDGAPPVVREASAPKPTAPSPAAHASQIAPTAQVAARPVAAEEVTVRRVRTEEPVAPEGRAEVRTESAPRAEIAPPRPALPAAAPVDPLAKPAVDTTRLEMLDPALADVAPVEGRSTADHAARVEATVRHDSPRPVMQQVAEAARALRDGPVELTLQPEELGKVKMTLSADADGVMTLSVHAERPETLDLLRRHIGDLARELQDMGFDNLSFSFGQDRASAERQRQSHGEDDAGERPLAAIPLAQQGFASRSTQTVTVGGLDLRL